MSILLVVQAGHDGTNAKDRQMVEFADSTVLDVALRRLNGFADGPLVVAISDLPGDDGLEDLARSRDAAVVRGPSDDLLARFVEVIADYPAEHLVRVRAGSPFVDHYLVSEIVKSHIESGADYTSNTLLRTYPQGLEIEVIRSDALLDAAEQAEADGERAGVTTFVHRRPANYSVHGVLAAGDYEDHAWQVTDDASVEHLTQLVAKSGGDLTRSWDSYLSYDRPQAPDSPVRLRVARENILSRLDDMTETIGYPPDPLPIGDPSKRSWSVWNGEELIGALTVAVQNGWGTLSGRFVTGLTDDIAPQALAALDDRLMADDQLIALTIDGSRIRTYRS